MFRASTAAVSLVAVLGCGSRVPANDVEPSSGTTLDTAGTTDEPQTGSSTLTTSSTSSTTSTSSTESSGSAGDSQGDSGTGPPVVCDDGEGFCLQLTEQSERCYCPAAVASP